jgi:hypothetical protein
MLARIIKYFFCVAFALLTAATMLAGMKYVDDLIEGRAQTYFLAEEIEQYAPPSALSRNHVYYFAIAKKRESKTNFFRCVKSKSPAPLFLGYFARNFIFLSSFAHERFFSAINTRLIVFPRIFIFVRVLRI